MFSAKLYGNRLIRCYTAAVYAPLYMLPYNQLLDAKETS